VIEAMGTVDPEKDWLFKSNPHIPFSYTSSFLSYPLTKQPFSIRSFFISLLIVLVLSIPSTSYIPLLLHLVQSFALKMEAAFSSVTLVSVYQINSFVPQKT